MNHMDLTLFQQSSPAKAGDPLLRRQQAQAWAKALVWATSNGARECVPDDRPGAPAVHYDPVGEMMDTTQS